MKKAVTINSIAEQLNLSRNTVAKALNGHYVPPETRRRVLEKAQEMGYKSLDTQRIEYGSKKYRILLVSCKPLNNIKYFIPLISGIETYCFQNNHELFQYTFNSSRNSFTDFSNYVKELNVDGIVAIECFEKDFIIKLLNMGIPVCFNDFCTSSIQVQTPFDIISANDTQCIQNFVVSLRKKYGIERFTFVGDRSHCRSFNDRYLGMRLGLLTAKIPHYKNEDILCGDDNFDYGKPEHIKNEILTLKHRPECYICSNDFIARNVCNALKLLDQSVPENAFVVGFDNVEEAYSLSPSITSFEVDKQFLGTETMRTLIHRIENPDVPSRDIAVTAKLIVRQSTTR